MIMIVVIIMVVMTKIMVVMMSMLMTAYIQKTSSVAGMEKKMAENLA